MNKPVIQRPVTWVSAYTGKVMSVEDVYKHKAETLSDYLAWENKPTPVKHLYWCMALSWN